MRDSPHATRPDPPQRGGACPGSDASVTVYAAVTGGEFADFFVLFN
jgi:hypothetical protein